MTQFYVHVNITKREFFFCGRLGVDNSLLPSNVGIGAAMNLLLADGNGEGGGDIARMVTYNPRNKKIPAPKDFEEEYVTECVDPNTKSTIYRPKLSGRWCGDQVVVAGEYGEPGKFLSNEELVWAAKCVADSHAHNSVRYLGTRINLFQLITAQMHYPFDGEAGPYLDISDSLRKTLYGSGILGVTEDRLVAMVIERLGMITAREYMSGRTRDLSWMSAEDTRMFTDMAESADDLRIIKKWLRQFKLSMEQRQLLARTQFCSRNNAAMPTTYIEDFPRQPIFPPKQLVAAYQELSKLVGSMDAFTAITNLVESRKPVESFQKKRGRIIELHTNT